MSLSKSDSTVWSCTSSITDFLEAKSLLNRGRHDDYWELGCWFYRLYWIIDVGHAKRAWYPPFNLIHSIPQLCNSCFTGNLTFRYLWYHVLWIYLLHIYMSRSIWTPFFQINEGPSHHSPPTHYIHHVAYMCHCPYTFQCPTAVHVVINTRVHGSKHMLTLIPHFLLGLTVVWTSLRNLI